MASDTSEPTCPALPRISGATRSPSIRSDANYRERGLDRHGNPISSRRAAYKWDPTSLCLHLVSENDPFFLIKRSVPPISPGTARNGLVVVLFCFFFEIYFFSTVFSVESFDNVSVVRGSSCRRRLSLFFSVETGWSPSAMHRAPCPVVWWSHLYGQL